MVVDSALRWNLSVVAVATALLLLLAIAWWQYRGLRSRVSRGPAVILAALRLAALALVLLVIMGPQLVRRTFQRVRRPIAVVIDTSRSMSLHGGLARSRLERVQELLAGDEFRRFTEHYLPEYFSFDEDIRKIPADGVSRLRPTGTRTILEAALGGVAGQMPDALAATIIFTDGGHQAPGAPAGTPVSGPVVVVGVGAGERFRDVEIRDASVPAIAFTGQPLALQVAVHAAGYAGREVPLLLKRGSTVLVSKTITLPADGSPREVRLEWTPPAPAAYPLTVQIPLQEGEQIEDNNRRDVSAEVVRDKIRVLLVSGSASWSYRFLRGALKGDPTIDLVSFIILRTATDAVDVPQQELSLIPFPTQKIFLEELPNFDLLIFDDFAYQSYLPAGYLDRVHDFVQGGGAFWMLGGPYSFSGGNYGQTAIGRILPVKLAEDRTGETAFRDATIRVRLTPGGGQHPFFRGIDTEDRFLPPLDGLNAAGPPRVGAVVLAEAIPPDGAPQPLIAIGRYGRGRVLAVLTDSLWRWAFEEVGRGRGNRAYLSLVRQAVRWSVGDPQLQPVRVEPERSRLVPGERFRARIHVLGEDYLPSKSAALAVVLRDPSGSSHALAAQLEAPGVYRVETDVAVAGTWEISAEASIRGSSYGRAAAALTASWPDEEFRDPKLNRDAIAAVLAGRRGAFVSLSDPASTVEAVGEALRELPAGAPDARDEYLALGEAPWVFLLFLGLLGSEWIIRRRAGLD